MWLVAMLLRDRSITGRRRCGEGKQTSIKEINFAGLLVRCREGFLETCVTFTEFITTSLLGLDALLANSFTAPAGGYKEMVVQRKWNFLRIARNRVTTSNSCRSRVKLLIIIIRIVIGSTRPAFVCHSFSASTVCGDSNRVEAVGPWNGRSIRHSRWRVRATSSAGTACGHAIGRKFTSADVVGKRGRRSVDAIRRREGSGRRWWAESRR